MNDVIAPADGRAGLVRDDDASDRAELAAPFDFFPVLRGFPFERRCPSLDFGRVQRRDAFNRQRAPVDRNQSCRGPGYHCSIRCLSRSTSPSLCTDLAAADAFAALIVS